MHRSKSFSSLLKMSQFNCANSPYEIFTQPSPFDEPFQLPDGSQPFDPRWHENNQDSDYSPEESSEPPPEVQTANNNQDIMFTNTAELRTVLATLSNYKTGQLGNHLKDCRGLILLPLHAVTALRTPMSNHSLEYPCIVFYPHQKLDNYIPNLPNLVEGINVLYPE